MLLAMRIVRKTHPHTQRNAPSFTRAPGARLAARSFSLARTASVQLWLLALTCDWTWLASVWHRSRARRSLRKLRVLSNRSSSSDNCAAPGLPLLCNLRFLSAASLSAHDYEDCKTTSNGERRPAPGRGAGACTAPMRSCRSVGKATPMSRWLGAAPAGHLAWKFLTRSGGRCTTVLCPRSVQKQTGPPPTS